jgi:hypothetical protein
MAATDKFSTFTPGLVSPADHCFEITPGTSDLVRRTRGLYIGGAGDVCVVDSGGNEVTFKSVPAGTTLPIRVDKVLASRTTGSSPSDVTTATGIIGLY